MSLIAKGTNRIRRKALCALALSLLINVYGYAQWPTLGINGTTSVILGTSYTYYPTFNGSSTASYNNWYQWTITGGVITGTSNTMKSGTCTSVLYSIGISVTWTSTSGTLNFGCTYGNKIISIAGAAALSPGTLSPSSQTINYGATATTITGTAATGGYSSPAYSYQWYSSPDNVSWTTIPGATGQNYSPGILYNSTWFYRKVTETHTSSTASTSHVPVYVLPQLSCSLSPTSQTITNGQYATTITSSVSGGNGSYSYDWKSSPVNSSYTSTGVTTANYSPGTLGTTTYYELVTTSNGATCTSDYSLVTVNHLPSGTLSVTSTTPSGNGTINQLTCSPSGGNGTYSYAWYSSIDGGSSYQLISGATSSTYTTGTITYAIMYYVAVSSDGNTGNSNTISITMPGSPTISADHTSLCNGASGTLTASGGSGNYIWYNSSDVQVGMGTTYSTTSSGIFYAVSSDTYGVSGHSNSISLSAITAPVTASILGNSICVLNSTQQLTDATPGGVWTSSNSGTLGTTVNGLLTGKSTGSATITYTVTNACGTSDQSLGVNVVPFSSLSPSLGTGVSDPVISDTISLVSNTVKTTQYTQDVSYSSAHTIQNVLALKINEELPVFIPGDFSAKVVCKIEYGHSSSDLHTIDSTSLSVSYTKDGGNKYNAINYFSFKSAEFVRITVLRVEAPTTVNGVSFDSKQVLLLVNSLAATRYYALADNMKPTLSYTSPSGGGVPDELPVSWVLPAHTDNNYTQLEWAWVEDEMAGAYRNGSSFDTASLFKSNSTRVDLPGSATAGSYAIPLLCNGVGKLFFRARAVNLMPSGSRSDGPWSGVQTFAFSGHNDSLNWQSTTTYAEEGKRKSVIRYYDGSLRARQTVTKDNSTGTTVVAETMYDGQGRPAIQVLPAPGISNIIAYTRNLNKFNTQPDNANPLDYFDFTTPALGKYATYAMDTTRGANLYYSSGNPAKTLTDYNQNIPAGNGYAYAVTRYTPDATGRIMAQSGVGDAMNTAGSHVTRYYYGTPAREELDALFGTEAGDYTHYFKNMVQDPNGQMSVSYVDMHGRTIATALAGEAPAFLQALDISDTTQYKNQAGKLMTRNLLDSGSNVLKNTSIESINSVLVPFPTLYSFHYNLSKQKLKLPLCNGDSVSYPCKFDLQISISDESGDTTATVFNYTGIDTINFQNALVLPAGSYSVRKTLSINADSLAAFLRAYDTLGMGICRTEQFLADSVAAQDSTASGCGVTPTTLTCSSCLASLGSYSTYQSNYATSLGDSSVNQLTSGQITDIRNQYVNDSSFCASLNSNTSHTLENIRNQMLADMIPYSGQYARSTGSGTVYANFNIFSTSGPSYNQPFYRYPRNESYTLDNYHTTYGQADATVNSTLLATMSQEDFEEAFQSSWASSLLPYHPEFVKLKFAEDYFRSSYDFIDSVNQTVNTAFNPVTSDPFFTTISTTADRDTIKKYSDTAWQNGYSMWQIAYGDALGCKVITDAFQRDDCYSNIPKQFTTTGTVVSTGTASVTLSADIQSQAWEVYKGLYSEVRSEMVNRYINLHTDTLYNSDLINQGYRIYFPYSNQQQASGFGWDSWYPAAGDTIYPKVNFTDSVEKYSSHCAGYITAWRNALLNCPALAGKSPADREAILNSITGKMELVCQYGTDAANPYGSSTVAPAYEGAADTSFEQVVSTVLDSAGISRDLYCNPYGIEYPKPYGKNPVFTKQYVASLDTCTCSQFSKILTAAAGAGYNQYLLSSVNQYLQATYQDTISQALYDGLQNCGQYYVSNCRQIGTVLCGKEGQHCPLYQCDTSYTLPLASPQSLPQFLTCGFSGGSYGCYSCDQFRHYDTTFYTLFGRHPDFSDSMTNDTTIAYNNLFAQYVNFKTGLQHDWLYYADQFRSSHCHIGGITGTTTALSICLDHQPLNDTTGLVTPVSPCQSVHDHATLKATLIYDLTEQQLLANFNAAYLAKCVSARESFNVTDTVKEYHYSLYYYDQGGNLVKTVPPKGVHPIYRSTWIDSVENAKRNGTSLTPMHSYVTRYCYNSLNQVNLQKSPDGGVSKFWYDRLGRLALSQNARQRSWGNVYSYTLYDALGRITEVGQINASSAMTDASAKNDASLQSWFTANTGKRGQITQTGYDLAFGTSPTYPNGVLYDAELNQQNLRNRVSYTQVIDTAADTYPASATYYSYDVHGNVDTLLQDFGIRDGRANMMNTTDNRFKKLVYDYDLISGKVNQVSYQPGQPDAYYQRYVYDAENRLTDVYSGRDSVMLLLFPEREARYNYYQHGPLARTELGQLRVQGLDYAYTLQGWLKGVNPVLGGTLANGTDTAEAFPVSQDVYGFSLHYYPGDYRAIGHALATNPLSALTANAAPLYNGNIAAMAVNIPQLGNPKVYNYHYDQLNRIVAMDAYDGLNPQTGTFTPISISDYRERVTYDPNGNILKYNRHGDAARTQMDSLTYIYKSNTNQLDQVADAAADAAPGDYSKYNDIKQGQSAGNYQYDAIGNLISDASEGITSITWNVYGKISSLTKSGQTVHYVYDASGNRIMKQTSTDTTAYVRDATGNVLSVYTRPASGTLAQTEMHLYGSSRLGMATQHLAPDTTVTLAADFVSGIKSIFTRGEKLFELSNHLGNVLATINDRRVQIDSNSDGAIDHYLAYVATASDYYPFGMMTPGRNYTASSTYRYGFNGQERSTELHNNSYTAEFWQYDSRIGRRYNPDPRPNPSISNYVAFANSPLFFSDPLGDTTKYYNMEGKELGTVNNEGSLSRIKVNERLYSEFQSAYSKAGGKLETQTQANAYVNVLNSALDNLEANHQSWLKAGDYGNDIISRETGVRKLTFTGSYSNKTHLASGTLSLNVLFENGSSVSINQWQALSGTVAKGGNVLYPLPNRNDYVGVRIENRSAKGFVRHGVGYVLMINDFPATSTWNRGLFRIHPDGNSPGSAGCIALQSGKNGLLLFKNLMRQYTNTHGNISISVNIASNPNIGYIKENEKGNKKVNYGE